MYYLKIGISILIVLFSSRFIPHPPNFTSLIALSFYVPALFGFKFIFLVLIAFLLSDLIIGLHQTVLFTWSSVILIGAISLYFNKSILFRLCGAFTGAIIFFIVTNLGVWSLGSYGYNLNGLLACYVMALPFFGYTAISTFIFSAIIEIVYKFYKFLPKKIFY